MAQADPEDERRGVGMTRPQGLDIAMALAVTATLSIMISADQAGDRAPDVLAYLWAAGLGALMLVRRSHPLLVLWLTVLGLFAYYSIGYPVVGLSVPTAAALFSAAEQRGPRWPALAAVVLLLVSYTARLLQGQDPVQILGYEAAGHVALMAAAIALGDALRTRRRLQRRTDELVETSVRLERSRAARQRSDDRTALARELHDSLGHQISVITLHADLAREAAEDDPGAAQEAMDVVARTGRTMLDELRSTVRQLRKEADGDDAEDPDHAAVAVSAPSRVPPTLHGLRRSVIPALPLRISCHIEVPVALPPAREAAAHRIAQEALTNIVRHSRAEEARLWIGLTDGGLGVEVEDPGPRRDPAAAHHGSRPAAGHGLQGMRERAEACGGSLDARPQADGFLVRALLPLSSDPEEHRRPPAAPGRTP
ncbi:MULTISPECIES: sensor histidine kinase [Actinomycetes]|uniref:histidine kinase n=2 Tax=Actinomycetes TaxID=1760 RepID=A0ABP6LS41_9MICC